MIYNEQLNFQYERGKAVYSEKFKIFIEMWRKEFAIERSIDEKLCIDRDGNPIPWYTYPAIEYLSQYDYRDKKIFEYGCGYSSMFWAQRAVKVVSVEDNQQWYNKWKAKFSQANLEIRQRDENTVYENAILEDGEKYDVIIIDGKRRAQCAEAAVDALADGGMIILDDSDRINTSDEYIKAVAALKNFGLLQVDFYGFCPMNNYSKTTSIFFCRNFNFDSLYKVQPINGWGNLWSKSRRERKEFYKKGV